MMRVMMEAIKSIGRFFAFILLVPVVFVMIAVIFVYACIESVRLWIIRTFKLDEQKI